MTTNNMFPIHCLSGKKLHICGLAVQYQRYGLILSKYMTNPHLIGVFQQLHVVLLQVTHDPIHQPSTCIQIHPIHHYYKGCKSKRFSVSIFQIRACLRFELNEIHVLLVLLCNYRDAINLCQPLANIFLPPVLSPFMFDALFLVCNCHRALFNYGFCI